MGLLKKIVKIFTPALRDRKDIFPLIAQDLRYVLGDVDIVAVGSRTGPRDLGKNDFDVLVRKPTIDQLRNAPIYTPSFWMFINKVGIAYAPEGESDHLNVILAGYRERVFPTLHKSWGHRYDEYGNRVRVDITFTDTRFPSNAIIL